MTTTLIGALGIDGVRCSTVIDGDGTGISRNVDEDRVLLAGELRYDASKKGASMNAAIKVGVMLTATLATLAGGRDADVRGKFAPLPVVGACCLPDGTCLMMYYPNCVVEGGVWHGPTARCEDMNCKPCRSDLDSDGAVDIDDIRLLIGCIDAGGCPDGVDGDVNGDGSVDDGDIVAMIDDMLSGVC
jgi:hypothetical protein